MTVATSSRRPLTRRLVLFLVCLLLVAAGCSKGDSAFVTTTAPGTTGPGGVTTTTGGGTGTTIPGGHDPGSSADAIPADAQVYAGFDLTAIPDLMRLVSAFPPDAMALAEGIDLGEAAGGVVEGAGQAQDRLTCIGEGLGFDPANLPAWLGAEASLGLFGMEFDAATGETTDPSVLIAVAVADQAGAEAFVQTLVGVAQGCVGADFVPTPYNGVTVYRAEPAGDQPIAIALANGYLLVGIGEGMVAGAIDLADGVSLAEDPNFVEVLAALPTGRHLTGFMSSDLPQQALEAALASAAEGGQLPLPAGLDPTQALAAMKGIGLAGTLLPEGVRVDILGVAEPNPDLPIPEATASGLPGLLPADAIGYLGIGAFDVPALWDGIMQMLEQMPVEEGQTSPQDSIALVGFMLGIDIEQDLVQQLTGEAGVGLLPATQGSLVTGAGVNLGIIAALGVKDPAAMTGTVDKLATGLGQAMEMQASPRPYSGGTLYGLSDGTSDIALFGMAGSNLVITTHESHAAALLQEGAKLITSPRYAEAIGGLPQGSMPVLYLDMAALVGSLSLDAEQAAALAPLQTVAMSVSLSGAVGGATIYARIDY